MTEKEKERLTQRGRDIIANTVIDSATSRRFQNRLSAEILLFKLQFLRKIQRHLNASNI